MNKYFDFINKNKLTLRPRCHLIGLDAHKLKWKSFYLKFIANNKNRGYHIPMIDLGKSKEVTSVLKLYTQFSPKKDFFRIFYIAFRFVGIKTYQMIYVRPHVLSVASNYICDTIILYIMYNAHGSVNLSP